MNVFLSYASSDQKLVNHLRAYLMKAGFKVWDPLVNSFPGDNLGTQIETALEESDAMVVILSPESQQSPFVNSEIHFALGSPRFKNRLILVLVEGSADVPWAQYVPIVNAKGRSGSRIGHLVVDALKKTAVKSNR